MSWARLALALAAGLALLWLFGSRDRLRTETGTADLPPDPQAWLAAREEGILPEVASYLHWAGRPGQVTPARGWRASKATKGGTGPVAPAGGA